MRGRKKEGETLCVSLKRRYKSVSNEHLRAGARPQLVISITADAMKCLATNFFLLFKKKALC